MALRFTIAGLLLFVFASLGLSACKQLQSSQMAPPAEKFVSDSVLVFEPDHVDIGTVKEGEEATGFLRVRNSGNSMANIVAVETSCGCSVAEPEQSLLMPGGFTRIKVVVDTFAKQGAAKKWVQLTDDTGHRSRAWVTLHVLPNPHLDASARSIFQGKCAACHYDTAKGKVSGAEIYQAVCAMCHGAGREGVSGPSLQHHKDVNALADVIANGVGSQHMPGFSQSKGGPLSVEQVAALSQWLSTLDE
ncbi:MAG: c-type cytochrome [Mariprofundus sp.]|nr:c-type cytochrome [Mariprofundus sp.]